MAAKFKKIDFAHTFYFEWAICLKKGGRVSFVQYRLVFEKTANNLRTPKLSCLRLIFGPNFGILLCKTDERPQENNS